MRGELETGTDCNILAQSSSRDHSCTSSSGILNLGSLRTQPSVWSWFTLRDQLRLELNFKSNSNKLTLQLNQAVCGTWLYNRLPSTCFLWASHLHRIQPVHRSRWYSHIFDWMHLFIDWRLGRRSICYTFPTTVLITPLSSPNELTKEMISLNRSQDHIKKITRLPIGPVSRVFTCCPGDQGSIPGRVIPKSKKMVLAAALFNTSIISYESGVKWSNLR